MNYAKSSNGRGLQIGPGEGEGEGEGEREACSAVFGPCRLQAPCKKLMQEKPGRGVGPAVVSGVWGGVCRIMSTGVA